MCIRTDRKFDLFLQKIDADYEEVWTNYYGTADSDGFKDGIISGDTIYMAGYATVETEAFGYTYNTPWIYVIKAAKNGDIIWENTYGRSHWQHYAVSLMRTADGHLLVAGHANISNSYTEILFTKIDANTGDSLWMQSYEGDFVSSATMEATGTFDFGYVLAGRGSYSISQDPHIYMMRLDNSAARSAIELSRTA